VATLHEKTKDITRGALKPWRWLGFCCLAAQEDKKFHRAFLDPWVIIMENKKSGKFYFGNNVDGNGIFPSLRFYWYQKIRGSISGSKVLEVFSHGQGCGQG